MSIDKNLPYEEVCEKVAAFLRDNPEWLPKLAEVYATLDFEKTVNVSGELANLMVARDRINREDSSMRMFTAAATSVVNELWRYSDTPLNI